MDAADPGVAVVGATVRGRLARPLVDRQRDVVARRADRALGTEDLDVAAGPAQLGAGDAEEELVLARADDADRDAPDDLGPVGERIVHLPAQLAADGEVGDDRGHRHRDGHRDGGGDRDAGAEAHGSRSA